MKMLPNGSSDILYMYVQFFSLESGTYRCVLGDVLLRFWASFPKIKGPLIPLNLAMSITSSLFATSVILSSLSTVSPFASAVRFPLESFSEVLQTRCIVWKLLSAIGAVRQSAWVVFGWFRSDAQLSCAIAISPSPLPDLFHIFSASFPCHRARNLRNLFKDNHPFAIIIIRESRGKIAAAPIADSFESVLYGGRKLIAKLMNCWRWFLSWNAQWEESPRLSHLPCSKISAKETKWKCSLLASCTF